MDLGHQLTDEELAKLERKIAKVYKTAADEMQDKITEYFKKFDEQDKKKRELLEQGKITEQEYKQWRLGKLATGKKYQSMRDQLAERMTNANQEAVAYVNSSTPTVYSLNRNYTAYQIEQADINASFQLWDESTVARLIKDNPELMPNYPKEKALARGIDLDWGKKQISKEITTGILLGESNQRIAKRLLTELPNMNKASAIRTARTATTSAENGGRLDTFKQAEQMGIPIKKQWRATHDGRTREEHILADGQIVGVDEPFIVGGEELMKPGDDSGSGWNIYNCRCRMYSIVKGRVLYNPDTDANYQKWLEAKQQGGARWEYVEKQQVENQQAIILSPDETIEKAKNFAKTIDYSGVKSFKDVRKITLDNLGYSGLPQVVDEKAFSEMSKEKTVFYRGVAPAPNKTAGTIADEFKNGELWTGNSGGAAYGNGVYFSLEKNIAKEYAGIDGEIIEMVMDKSAKIVDYETIFKEYFETGIPTTIGNKREDYHDIIADVGQYAAMKGYDAIQLNGFNGNNHFILLNRTKAIIRG